MLTAKRSADIRPQRAGPIRICHVQLLPIISGAQRSMLEIFKQLDPARYEIHVACQGAGPLTGELERLGIAWHAIPALDRPIRPYQDWVAYCQLYRLFQQYQFAIVHTHSSKPGVLGRVAARRAGVPTVVHHVRGFAFHEFSSPLTRHVYSRVERWAGRYCDRVLFVNHEERELSIRCGWLPAEKCQTIYNGVDLPAIDRQARRPLRARRRAQWQIDDDETAILFAGRLAPQKQPLILPAIVERLLSRQTRHRWRLIVAGAGPDEQRLRSEIDRLGVGNQICIAGWLDEPYAAAAAADVVLLPSLFEGLPRTLIEAQGAGLPIVASDVKGNREVVTPETGFLCRPRDADDYADKLALLVDDARLRNQLGRAARVRAEQHFDTVVNHGHIAALYDELLCQPQQSEPLLRAA